MHERPPVAPALARFPRKIGLSAALGALLVASLWACGADETAAKKDAAGEDALFGGVDAPVGDAPAADAALGDTSLGDMATTAGDADASCTSGKTTCADLGHLSTCVAGVWQATACAADEVCSDLACVKKQCTPPEKRCTADLKAAETCDARGAGWSKTLCQIDEACVAGACVKLTCKPGKKTCGTPTTVLTCKPDGQGHDEELCGADHGCDPGYGSGGAQAFCKAHVCQPKQSFCAENKALQCADDGLAAKELENCNKNDSVGKPMACKGGVCLSVKCEPGSFACLGWTQVGKCKADGSGYASTSCGTGLVCEKGTCKAQACAPDEAFCEGKIAKLCDKLGTTATIVGDCAVSGSDCVKGKCAKPLCTPDAKQCSADYANLEVCDAGGYQWVASPCVKGQACVGAACKPVLCTPGVAVCKGNVPVVCDGSGTQETPGADCGKSVCVAGVCKTKDCPTGTTTCQDASTQLVCNANSVGGVAKPCPVKTACLAGVCKTAVCEPAKAWCDGTVGKTCALDGMKIIAQSDCSKSNQVCKEGGCIDKGCGDGQCTASAGETCSTCAKDCGACPFDGCTGRSQPGCDKCTCESCVCQFDPSCCTGSWTGSCANLCKTACGGTCP